MPGTTSETILRAPTTFTISGGADVTLAKIDGSKPYASEYQYIYSDGSVTQKLNVANTFKNNGADLRNYINFLITTRATPTTPEYQTVVSMSISGPVTKTAEIMDQVQGLCGLMTDANLLKWRSGQS